MPDPEKLSLQESVRELLEAEHADGEHDEPVKGCPRCGWDQLDLFESIDNEGAT